MGTVKKQEKGFTIIEVVLVLAIAGLIMLMVFIALPALQRGQRDQARKNDVSTVAAAVNTYRSNNRGSFTGISGDALQKYIDRLDQYDVASVTVEDGAGAGTITPTVDDVKVKIKAKCPDATPAPGSANIAVVAGTARSAVVVTALEGNGSNAQIYCQDL